jgi:homoserine O-acetyltransferase
MENTPSVDFVRTKFFTFGDSPDSALILDSGVALSPVTLAYETYGTLDAEGSNAVLICHALTGDAHVAGYHPGDAKPGWWDHYVGPGKPIDTDRYFVICSNILGSCMGSSGPTSINPATGNYWGLDFPLVTIADMVRAQRELLRHLGISHLLAVVGGSLGGMQTLQWAADYPEMMDGVLALATTSRNSPQAIAFNEVARQSIMSDPHWNGGDYYEGRQPDLGLAVARMIGHITYLSDESMHMKFGRELRHGGGFAFNFETEFQVESYLHHQGKKFVERFDANAFLYMTKASDYFDLDLSNPESPARQSLGRAKARFLLVSFTSDWLYPTYQSRQVVEVLKALRRDVSFCEITASWGHDAFLLPDKHLETVISGFLRGLYAR